MVRHKYAFSARTISVINHLLVLHFQISAWEHLWQESLVSELLCNPAEKLWESSIRLLPLQQLLIKQRRRLNLPKPRLVLEIMKASFLQRQLYWNHLQVDFKCMFRQCKVLAQPAGEELPEIEKCFPYNPSGKPDCLYGFGIELFLVSAIDSVLC